MSSKTDKPHNKGGRPKIEVTPEQVENLAQYGLNHTEIAAALGISRATIERRMEQTAYREAFERGRGKLGAHAKKLIIDSAKKGNVKAQLFLVQNASDWSSKQRVQVEGEQKTFVVEIPAPQTEEEWLATWGPDGYRGRAEQMARFAQPQPETV